MNTHIIYTQLKAVIEVFAPVFQYTGQYTTGKNIQLLAPALYIEMPKGNLKIDHYPRGIETIRKAKISIHIISHAPYQSHDTATQEAALAAHQSLIDSIGAAVDDLVLRDNGNRLLSGAFIKSGMNTHQYRESFAFTIISYTVDLFAYPPG